ncbi:DUF6807 family protein [Arthrobacter sp. M4]|uniref:DUF6807 family protein n=1 Tax=Arthrobacter sp. M4 TaxID=218160 RepID=UPI001CDCE293|nr:DUF6807 family protein [Arthrobacter sp. M4]MCA4135094.1 PmoA family protein [Arthrobacter sp. M4]
MDTPSAETTDQSGTVESGEHQAEQREIVTSGTEVQQAPVVAARIALVGVHGFGAHHLANLRRLENQGAVKLVAVADPNPPGPGELPESVTVHNSLDSLLAGNHQPDVIIVATPIQTHAPLALAVLASSADLYLEKPPVASMADFLHLQEAAEQAGRSVQIGFQSLGSHALAAIDSMLANGSFGELPGIGELQGISATGRWIRDRAYYKRSRWAGKRSMDGVDVVDGVATNPLAHAIATALRIANAMKADDLESVETDLYHANEIESDDTSVIRIRTTNGLPITCALTLCATESVEPYVTLHGTEGTATFHYTQDLLTIRSGLGETQHAFGRDDLTENLLQHLAAGARSESVPLLSPLENSGAFMRVLEAIRTAEPPAQIPDSAIDWHGEGDAAHPVVRGIEDALERATKAHATFSDLGLPWARPASPDYMRPLFAGEPSTLPATDGDTPTQPSPAVVLRSGGVLPQSLSPRPYLHPVSTLAGTVVTDHLAADHPWHLGVGIAIQDVNGANLWGGRSYRRSAGAYLALKDHGRITLNHIRQPDANTTQLALRWTGPDGAALLDEQRTLSRTVLDDRTWRLDLRTELTAVVDASLGSPGSHGARGSGYGGFFWRLPAMTNPRVFTPRAEGEPAVHGTVSPWLAWTGTFGGTEMFDGGGSPGDRTGTLVFAAPPEASDPWFVRMAGYPAVGSALAWDKAVELATGETLRRSYSIWISDGILPIADIQRLVAER